MAEHLAKFFRENGWIANMPANYAHYVQLILHSIEGACNASSESSQACKLELHKPEHDYQYCIDNGMSYEYIIKRDTGKIECCIPVMTDEGYFIVDGEKKVLLIQEVKLKTEHYIISDPPSCECNLMGSYNPVKISIQNGSQLQMDTSMIYNDIRNIDYVGIGELLITLDDKDEDMKFNVFMLFLMHSNKELAEACMLLTFTNKKGGLKKSDLEVIRVKIFCGQSNNIIIFTIIPMIVECVKMMLSLREPSDRDNYVFKKLKTPGEILHTMIQSCLREYKKTSFRTSVKNIIDNCLKRGEVKVNNTKYVKMAVQFSERSRIDALSSIRKVRVPCDENSASMSMRQIHESQIGYICPCETPEGKTVGVMKHLASTCLISVKSLWYYQEILSLIECYTEIGLTVSVGSTKNVDVDLAWIQLDGMVIGWCSYNSAQILKLKLKTHNPNWGVVLFYSSQGSSCVFLKIRTTQGRPLRPLVLTDLTENNTRADGGSKSSDYDFNYMDPDEFLHKDGLHGSRRNCYYNCRFKELHPCTMLGLAASLIPFPEHNQSARNVFASSMIKQSQQMIGSDKTCSMLQMPIVSTLIARLMEYEPNGINLITCIMAISGYNEEDAIIVNKACVDRGAFNSKVMKKVYIEVNNPWKLLQASSGSPVIVMSGGIERIIHEVKPMLQNEKLVSVNDDLMPNGKTKLTFTFEEHRTLQLGDKLSSRHGQKGVVGMLMSQEDMPFNMQGITPDIIINPHAIPSRMTVGQLIEGVLAKKGANSYTFKDGTPFIRENKEEMKDILRMSDTERMILGTTGEMIQTPITMGIVYYMALSHQVEDKVYVRSYGPTSMMSRQPISGRSKGGGLRFGGMEYDCLVAHGASKLITGISLNSDSTNVPYCTNCCVVMDVQVCTYCNMNTVQKIVPFSYVVMKDLMLATGIKIQSVLS